MKYIDPLPVKCPSCGETCNYSVKDLLSFQADCLVCHYDLAAIGKTMREKEAELAFLFFDLGDFVLKLEDNLHLCYEDKEIENLKTVEDLFYLTQTKLPSDYNPEKLKQLILETASEGGNYSVAQLSMEMSLREILEKNCDS